MFSDLYSEPHGPARSVSGYRFSDAVTAATSVAPSGAVGPNTTRIRPTHLWTFRRSETIAACGRETCMSQKYRQHGYQDRGRDEERQKQSTERPVKKETFGPRALQMPGTHAVSRCAQCGTLLTSITEPIGKCPKCGFELHSCRQCTYFDTSSRFECTQPIPERIPRKDERNQCTFYSMRVRVEKETSTPSSARPTDARTAFENLFKK
jgi:hypothetical protein